MAKRGDLGANRIDAAAARGTDPVTHAILFQGVSISQLGVIFEMDRRTVTLKISSLSPVATRGGSPIYRLREAAQYLVKPLGDIEEHIRKMNPEDLPPLLQRTFWSGLREKNNYMHEAGDLWDTGEVLETLSTVFSELSMNLQLMQDAVAEQTHLTERQREIITQLVDGHLESARDGLTKRYSRPQIREIDSEAGERISPYDSSDEFAANLEGL